MNYYSKIFVSLSAIFCCALVSIYAQTGIGTTNPKSPLHIVDAQFPQLTIASASGQDSATFGVDTSGGLVLTTAGNNNGNIILQSQGGVGIGTLPDKLFSIGNSTDKFSFSVSGSRLQVWNDANPPVLVFEFDSAGTNRFNALKTTSASDMEISLESGSSNESMIFQTQDSSGQLTDRIILDNFTNTSALDIVNADLDVDNGVFYVDSEDDEIGINTSSPQGILDLSNSSEPMIVPRLSSTQILLYLNPKKGELLFDTTLNLLYIHNGLIWKQLN
ncbi:MAG: hypothetical protein WD077_04285 [Bacteroidia bacterium]